MRNNLLVRVFSLWQLKLLVPLDALVKFGLFHGMQPIHAREHFEDILTEIFNKFKRKKK